jgi:thioredoxin reductase (NADPH)
MSHYLIGQIRDSANIEVRTNTMLIGAAGAEHLERLRLCDTAGGKVEEVPAGFLFVFIGAAPCTEWLDGTVERDRQGFVVTGPDLLVGGQRPRGWPLDRDPYYLEGSVPGVFAAGDARCNSVKRVASAVGEGAMAIQLVHRYLEAQ